MIITRTPFRLPLGGGGTDLPAYYRKHGGFLITSAINKYMFININQPALVHKIKVNYTKTEIVDQPEELKHDLVRESLKLLNIGAPLEIHSMADLSGGTGLGSSSTYTVGLLLGLTRCIRHVLSTQELAELACTIEIEKVGKPIGKQDQYAAAFGGIITMEIDQKGVVKVNPLQLHNEIIRDYENHLMMFFTKIERTANEILGEQSEKLSIKSQGDVEKKGQGDANTETSKGHKTTKSQVLEPNIPDEVDAVQAMHQIKEIGYQSMKALENGDCCLFGELMHHHWEIKKKISKKMSSPQIDRWYDMAMNAGALGGKIMGAGGGGFFLFCVKDEKRKHVLSTLENAGLRYMDFRFDFEGSKVIANI